MLDHSFFSCLTRERSFLFSREMSSRAAGVVDIDVAMPVSIEHRKARWYSCLAAPEKRIVFLWEGWVGNAPLPLLVEPAELGITVRCDALAPICDTDAVLGFLVCAFMCVCVSFLPFMPLSSPTAILFI